MKYFFVLGINPALSVAELGAILPVSRFDWLAPDFLIVETTQELKAAELIKRLGGTVKIGRILNELESAGQEKLIAETQKIAAAKQAVAGAGKFNFGFSDYGERKFDKKDLGLKLKKYFSEAGVSSRFVISREKNLSSVVVAQNKLLTRGVEIILASRGNTILIGETLAVQPFKDLSLRDYGRPSRDDKSGMLPPKLAQIMINLAGLVGPGVALIDPFCGSGTILTEALLLGYKNLFGSDISPQAVADTQKNISWTGELYKVGELNLKLSIGNAVELSKSIESESIDAVVTEPYLGPQRGRIEFKEVIKSLENLYSAAFIEFGKILKNGGRVVMVWPMYYGERPITPNHNGFKIVNMIPENLRQSGFIKKNNRETIVYGRPGQKVYREIVVLEKI